MKAFSLYLEDSTQTLWPNHTRDLNGNRHSSPLATQFLLTAWAKKKRKAQAEQNKSSTRRVIDITFPLMNIVCSSYCSVLWTGRATTSFVFATLTLDPAVRASVNLSLEESFSDFRRPLCEPISAVPLHDCAAPRADGGQGQRGDWLCADDG